jgi:hypothetical protein
VLPGRTAAAPGRILAVGPRKSLDVYDTAAERYNVDRATVGQDPLESRTDEQLGVDTGE